MQKTIRVGPKIGAAFGGGPAGVNTRPELRRQIVGRETGRIVGATPGDRDVNLDFRLDNRRIHAGVASAMQICATDVPTQGVTPTCQ